MQTIVQLSHVGHEHNFTLKFIVRLENAWVPIEQIGSPPHNLRVLQVFRGDKTGWLALLEPKRDDAA